MLHCIIHIFVVMLDIRSITGFAKQPDLSEAGNRSIRESLKVVFPNEGWVSYKAPVSGAEKLLRWGAPGNEKVDFTVRDHLLQL